MGVMAEFIAAGRRRLAQRLEASRGRMPLATLVLWDVLLPPDFTRRLRVEGRTKSEGRAAAKRALGLARLPPGTVLVRAP